ncbi:glycosyltransferase [Aeromonas salmonicida]|uniref:glycosyltransferase n=1 Tax=Aeromonas salmonicida TaxID=645 RepID=UPI00259EF645|nr:glycosyltransferase [Aeromonas salmonicida]MDM5115194.1 glycosyltransferase [Aeromonas salmonicida]
MKKIAFLIERLHVGGAEKVLLEYIKLLSSTSRYSLLVITSKDNKDAFLCQEIMKYAQYAFLIEDDEGRHSNFITKIRRSLNRKAKLKFLLTDCDVIVDFLDADFHKYIKNFKNKKITWLHSSFINLEKRKRSIRAKCDGYEDIVLICQDMRAEVEPLNVPWWNRTSVIYNPFDFSLMESEALNYSKLTSREKGFLSCEYILSVSRLDEKTKDISGLIKAFSIARENGLNKKLFIIGDGEDRRWLEELSNNLGLRKEIVFLGQQSNPYVWMKHASSFVLSSKGEGFGLVLVEALFLTGSVISTDCPVGPSEILERGSLGALYQMGDCEGLAKLLCNPPPKLENVDLKKYSKERLLHDIISLLEK